MNEQTPLRTAQAEFDAYVQAVYPDAPTSGTLQYEELRRAFFAGCHIGMLCEQERIDLFGELYEFALYNRSSEKAGQA